MGVLWTSRPSNDLRDLLWKSALVTFGEGSFLQKSVTSRWNLMTDYFWAWPTPGQASGVTNCFPSSARVADSAQYISSSCIDCSVWASTRFAALKIIYSWINYETLNHVTSEVGRGIPSLRTDSANTFPEALKQYLCSLGNIISWKRKGFPKEKLPKSWHCQDWHKPTH